MKDWQCSFYVSIYYRHSLTLKKLMISWVKTWLPGVSLSVLSSLLSVCFLLKLIRKCNGRFWKTYHLFFSPGFSINDRISTNTVYLSDNTLDSLLQKVVEVGRHFIIIKYDIKNVICHIFMTLHIYWHLGFYWRVWFYIENCPFFELSTLSFIFNLFAEPFHWILQSFLGWNLEHYLVNFVTGFLAVKATLDRIWIKSINYACLIEIHGIPWQETKDLETTVMPILGIEIETNFFTLRFLRDKFHKV